jgi:anti-sigma factor RsiW
MTDKWTDRLSEYLDGELTSAETESLEDHLMTCAECGRTLQQLRAVVTRAGNVIDREPSGDLWSGIAARIAVAEPETDTIVATSRGRRRVSFSIPQLAAASIVLMLTSAGTMYLLTQRNETNAPISVSAPAPVPAGAASIHAVTRNYDSAVHELETVLERNRDQLDTATVRVLQQNLAIIDRAITEARAALGQEPANQYLSRYLDEAMQKKVQLLRRATSVMRSQT